ncbi:hypothetical protein LCGC14_1237190 [marine sediment metagenome]|uniref:Uncharacterized protein n=1 Tax=marine sediment metagenome TaxID=412755 RepID=A0A0F9LU14_9ZZZZ
MGIFFARNKTQAMKRTKDISKREGIKLSKPKLAKKQIKHIDGFKTFESKRIKKGKKR